MLAYKRQPPPAAALLTHFNLQVASTVFATVFAAVFATVFAAVLLSFKHMH